MTRLFHKLVALRGESNRLKIRAIKNVLHDLGVLAHELHRSPLLSESQKDAVRTNCRRQSIEVRRGDELFEQYLTSINMHPHWSLSLVQ